VIGSLDGIEVLFCAQVAKPARLHVKGSPEDLSKIVRILVSGRRRDFDYIHRSKQEQVFGLSHSCAMNAVFVEKCGLNLHLDKIS
jgi:hypothetical protein